MRYYLLIDKSYRSVVYIMLSIYKDLLFRFPPSASGSSRRNNIRADINDSTLSLDES